MSDKMRLGYFGDGPWAHRTLDLITSDSNIEIVFICARYTNPDEYLRKYANELGVSFISTQNVNSDSFIREIALYEADLFVSMSFDQIMRRELYELPKHGTINCHAGKLPLYRGRNVLNWALINDEKEFGITVHYVDDGVDSGDIILQTTYPISDKDNYNTLLEKAYEGCPVILHKAIRSIQDGTAERIKQSTINCEPIICTRRQEGDEQLEWSMTSREIFNFVRALTCPGPGALAHINANTVKIQKVELIPNAPIYKGISGSILAKEGSTFIVKTGDSYIRLTKWLSKAKLKAGARFS